MKFVKLDYAACRLDLFAVMTERQRDLEERQVALLCLLEDMLERLFGASQIA